MAKIKQLPFVHHQRWRHAEADHVGQAVHLFTKRTLAVGHARHSAVHAIQNHGGEDEKRGFFKFIVYRRQNNRLKCGKQRRNRERVGQQINRIVAQAFLFVHVLCFDSVRSGLGHGFCH